MRESVPQKSPKRLARWSLLIAGTAAILFIVGVSTARETYRSWKVDQEMKGLQAQVDALETKKSRVSQLIQTMQSEAALDKEARLRLNMQKPGERVFVYDIAAPDSKPTWSDTTVLNQAAPVEQIAVNQSNPNKWWSYFFKP